MRALLKSQDSFASTVGAARLAGMVVVAKEFAAPAPRMHVRLREQAHERTPVWHVTAGCAG